jgi:hypothetical protein
MERQTDPAPSYHHTSLAVKLFLAKDKTPTTAQPKYSSDLLPESLRDG